MGMYSPLTTVPCSLHRFVSQVVPHSGREYATQNFFAGVLPRLPTAAWPTAGDFVFDLSLS